MPTQKDINSEPLPGYTVVERIGAGGYGEVFKVLAPGGLSKALKIIYGYTDERRATDELKALERIKQVRHPFLLSLERIEAVEGRLIIVTELAEESLRDRFNHCVRDNALGIPRKELLGYIRDAADALDYLCDEHGLQHLDVKPENLLLLAGHIKVADFGLVKDLEKTGVSFVGGLTPYYAAPEVFRGNPSRYSDQYSLAILYQQMLTGSFPFSGATAAEMTLQHLNDEPNLTGLSSGDRRVLRRALNKNPQNRYPTCREMGEALANTDSGDVANSAQSDIRRTPVLKDSTVVPQPATPLRTQVLEPGHLHLGAVEPLAVSLPPRNESAEDAFLADFDPSQFQPVPTLFIGIGEAASRVLGHLRRRTISRFGNVANMPSIKTLLIDTDPKTLVEASHASGPSRIAAEETLALCLRRPQDYRSARQQHLRWISRRWLFNIPKSLRTHGIRPLGRLAFVDHARQARQRIRQMIMQATDSESVAATRKHTGLPLQSGGPRIYLIASISGGTGGGMVLDVAYTVQALLKEMELHHGSVHGVLMHSTPRNARAGELAKINAFSWLTEFNHFNRPGAMCPRGEPLGSGPLDNDQRPFESAHFAHMGQGISADEFDTSTRAVAEFVFQDSFTPAQAFFDRCRRDDLDNESNGSGKADMRGFDIYRKTAADEARVDQAVAEISSRVISGWLGKPEGGSQPAGAINGHGTERASREKLFSELRLEAAEIIRDASQLVTDELGTGERSFFECMVSDACASDRANCHALVVSAVDRVFWPAIADTEEVAADAGILEKSHNAIVAPAVDKAAHALTQWIWGKLDDENTRWSGTVSAAEWVRDRLCELETTINVISTRLRHDTIAARNAIADNATDERSPFDSLFPYFQGRLRCSGIEAAKRLVRKLKTEVTKNREQLVETGREIRQLASSLAAAIGPALEENESCTDGAWFSAAQEAGLVIESSRQFQEEFVGAHGGVRQVIISSAAERKASIEALQAIVRRQVAAVVDSVDIIEPILGEEHVHGGHQGIDQLLEESERSLPKYGVRKHKLVILPATAGDTPAAKAITASLDGKANCVKGEENALVVCSDVGPLSIPHLAYDIIDSRRDYVDFAKRVHTRIDISWSSLLAMEHAAPQPSADAASPSCSECN